MFNKMEYFLGVDVGTSSVRVGLFGTKGQLIDSITEPIKIFNVRPDFYEQSSEEIWNAVCLCIKNIISNNCGINKKLNVNQIASIGKYICLVYSKL